MMDILINSSRCTLDRYAICVSRRFALCCWSSERQFAARASRRAVTELDWISVLRAYANLLGGERGPFGSAQSNLRSKRPDAFAQTIGHSHFSLAAQRWTIDSEKPGSMSN